MNALRHGYCGRAWLLRARRIRDAIRLSAETVLLARVLMRLPRPDGNDASQRMTLCGHARAKARESGILLASAPRAATALRRASRPF